MMLNLKKMTLILLGLLVTGGLWAQETPNSVKIGDMVIQWQTDDGNLVMEVSAPTTGWVSVGFNPSKMMKDADIIIGCVKEDGEVVIEDHFGTSMVSHAPDTELGGEDNISDAEGSEDEGVTTLKFIIPLDSGDENDTVLSAGTTHKMIVAYGSSDDLTERHAFRDSVDIEL